MQARLTVVKQETLACHTVCLFVVSGSCTGQASSTAERGESQSGLSPIITHITMGRTVQWKQLWAEDPCVASAWRLRWRESAACFTSLEGQRS